MVSDLLRLMNPGISKVMGAVDGFGGLAGPTATPTAIGSARLSPWSPASWSSAQANWFGSPLATWENRQMNPGLVVSPAEDGSTWVAGMVVCACSFPTVEAFTAKPSARARRYAFVLIIRFAFHSSC